MSKRWFRSTRAQRVLAICVVAGALLFASIAPASAVDSKITNDALYNEANSYANGETVGNCKAWVGQVFQDVAIAAGSSARIGPGMYSGFVDAGGVTVPEAQAVRGDLVFVYNPENPEGYFYGMHAAFIVNNLGNGRYDVIDANYAPFGIVPDNTLQRHVWDTRAYIAEFPTAFTVVVFRLGTVPSVEPPGLEPVFRFYNPRNGTHFYTPSTDERDSVMKDYPAIFTYEGIAYFMNPAANTQPLYRFYNIKSQSHFYTASPTERDDVKSRLSATYQYDGETYWVCPTETPNSVAVYRFYNLKNGSHFYTSSITERDSVMAGLAGTYNYEGPAFWLGQ